MEALEAVLRAKTLEQIERLERRVVRSGLSILRTGNSVHIRIPFLLGWVMQGYRGAGGSGREKKGDCSFEKKRYKNIKYCMVIDVV